jgi:hypothetical protein
MKCSECVHQKQHNELMAAVREVREPLALLYSLVSILSPEGASMANATIMSQEEIQGGVLAENKANYPAIKGEVNASACGR